MKYNIRLYCITIPYCIRLVILRASELNIQVTFDLHINSDILSGFYKL